MVDHVNAVRGVACWVIRTVAVVLAGVGTYLILKRLLLAVFTGSPSLAFQTWDGIGDGHAGARGVSMILIATVLVFAGNRLVRWAIPVPPEGCPRCGHRIDPTDAPTEADGSGVAAGAPAGRLSRCPECGLQWLDRHAARVRGSQSR